MDVTLIFPHQLFKNHPALLPGRKVVLAEEWLFFRQYNFHKQKIILHRASMQYYKKLLQYNGYIVDYIDTAAKHSDVRYLIPYLSGENVSKIYYADVADDWLRRRLKAACSEHDIVLEQFATPAFLNTMEEANAYFNSRTSYFQTNFYIAERKKRNILIKGGKYPEGGRWSYDADNRKRMPAGENVPWQHIAGENEFVAAARGYVEKYFSNNPGSSSVPFAEGENNYPVTHKEAQQWLQHFLQYRFHKFGMYEDAMVAGKSMLYHSVLSPLLNTGLLLPQDVIDQALHYAPAHAIPLNSLEGFIRQVVGWREYIRILYEREGRRQRTANYWKFTRKIPYSFWQGATGLGPIDTVIRRLLQCGYTHHIERLMILGNFMMLCEFDPGEVYRWFMEMYIDAYDWVMVPNIYGMSQFADGGIMITKPYISSSNYIKKMGDFDRGEWEHVWDALFWRFMSVHRSLVEKNPRLSMLLSTWDKMDNDKKHQYLYAAEAFLKQLDEP